MLRRRGMRPCLVCGGRDLRTLHRVRERIYGLPGTWELSRCASCGLVRLEEPPADLGAYYPKRASDEAVAAAPPLPEGFERAHYQAAFGPRWSPLRLVPLRGVRRGMVLRRGGRHLDVGCHTGDFLAFTRSLGMEVAGVELDAHAAEVARSRGIDVRQGTLFDAKFPDKSFDVITLNHVFEHLPEPDRHLDELRRILKDDGTIIIATPNPESLQHAFFGDAWVHLDAPRHLHLFAPRVLARLARDHGLRTRRVRYLSSWGYLLKSARYRSNDRREAPKDYFAPHARWGSRWADRLMSVPLALVDLARRGEEYEIWLVKDARP